jgi:6-bladed beta-propeller
MRYSATCVLAATLACAVLAASGCGPERTAAAGTGLDSSDRPLALAFDSLYTVGAIDGEAWETFGSVSQVAFDASGRLYVFDQQNERIIVVAADGSFVREVGKAGNGPGEFQSPTRMAVAHDGAIAVADFGVSGFTLFDPQGAFTRTVPITSDLGMPMGDVLRHPTDDAVVIQDAGMLRLAGGGGRGALPTGGPPEPPSTIPIRKVSLDTGDEVVLHDAWRPPPPENASASEVQGRNEGGGRMFIRMSQQVAFQPRVHLAVLPDGRYLVADSSTYTIDMLGPDGTVQETLARPVQPVPVTDDIREAEKARRLAALESGTGRMVMRVGGGGGAAIGGDMAKQLEEMQRNQIASLLFADVVPVIAGLATDWTGRIWVERAPDEPGEPGPIDLIDTQSRYYGTIDPDGPRIPAAFGPDGLVAYIEMDEFDVQTVRVMRLRPLEAR